MLDSKGKPISLTGNSSWASDWTQWGFDHFPPSNLGEYDYYRYRRYTKERPRKTSDEYLTMLNTLSSREAKKAANYYNMIKSKHTEFYTNVREEQEEKLLEIQLKNNTLNKNLIIPKITPEIIPTIVATSSLLPLGIIALFLYSRTGRK